MTEKLYLLWFEKEIESGCDIELFIGVYSTESDAQKVVDRLKSKPGFVDFPEGLQIRETRIGQTGWDEGYVQTN